MKARFLTVTAMILLAAASRLIPHPYNFAPIAGVALFGGAQFRSKGTAFLIPFGAMFLSDLVLGFHSQMPAVYLSFALIVLIGRWVRQQKTWFRIGGAALTSSALFFILTNFGVWALDSIYPKTFDGLVACYVAAIPFFHNTLLGDMTYTLVLFGGFAWAEKALPSLREPTWSPAPSA